MNDKQMELDAGRADEDFEQQAASPSKPTVGDVVQATAEEISRTLRDGARYRIGDREIQLSADYVRKAIAIKSKQGIEPSDEEVALFIRMCEARQLDPFSRDVFLVGYDDYENGQFQNSATFSIIVAVQALWKRAEANPHYDGIQAGVIIWKRGEDQVRYVDGTMYAENLTDEEGFAVNNLVGAWAIVLRDDRKENRRVTVHLKAYDKQRVGRDGKKTSLGNWKDDKAAMIEKAAIAKALREAFPNECGGLFVNEESAAIQDACRKETANEHSGT